jgi:hypothetical protein
MLYTLSIAGLFSLYETMEPFPIRCLTRQEVERAAIDNLGARFPQQWRYRRVPARWQLKLIKHFGAMIIPDAVACQVLPPMKQKHSR